MQFRENDFQIRAFREVSDHSRSEINRFTSDLADISGAFTPYISDHINVEILRRKEVPYAYRHASPDSNMRKMSPDEVLEEISKDIYSLDGFENSVLSTVHEISVARRHRDTQDYILPYLSFSDPKVMKERCEIIKFVNELSKTNLRMSIIQIVTGELKPDANERKFLKKARERFDSGEYDIKEISLNPGRVTGVPTRLLKKSR